MAQLKMRTEFWWGCSLTAILKLEGRICRRQILGITRFDDVS